MFVCLIDRSRFLCKLGRTIHFFSQIYRQIRLLHLLPDKSVTVECLDVIMKYTVALTKVDSLFLKSTPYLFHAAMARVRLLHQ